MVYHENVPVTYYNGNFSLLQAGEIVYSRHLSFDLKRDVARRMFDFELLLRGLNELGVRPLVLSMPIDGRYFDRFGVGRLFRDLYYKRIRGLAQVHDVPLVDFEDHDLDEDFLADHHDHLTAKGWLYFDKALDDFFHDRLVLQPGT